MGTDDNAPHSVRRTAQAYMKTSPMFESPSEAWPKVLPVVESLVDDALRAIEVRYLWDISADEWIGDCAALAVYWSMPKQSRWERVLGRSVSFLLDEDWVLQMWGAVWEDDWEKGQRRVREVGRAKAKTDALRKEDIRGFAESLSPVVKELVSVVHSAQLGREYKTTSLSGSSLEHR